MAAASPPVMFGASAVAAARTSLTFVAPAAIEAGLADQLLVHRRLAATLDTRGLGKEHMPENSARPRIEVDPDSFAVRVDGELIEEMPVAELPMAQRYFLF